MSTPITSFGREAAAAIARSKNEPAWLVSLREEAGQLATELALPKPEKLPLTRWTLDHYGTNRPGQPAASAADLPAPIAALLPENRSSALIVQHNSSVIYTELSDELKAKGVVLTSLEDAARNHEELFRRFLDDPLEHRQWLDMGGHETLHSYGLDGTALLERYREDSAGFRRVLREAIPDEHRTLLETLPIALRIGGYIFVHAGIRPGVPLEEQTDEDLLWIREPFLTEGSGLPATVVHGHTPSPEPTAGPGRIGIDTRAYDTGRLTVLKVTARSAAVL